MKTTKINNCKLKKHWIKKLGKLQLINSQNEISCYSMFDFDDFKYVESNKTNDNAFDIIISDCIQLLFSIVYFTNFKFDGFCSLNFFC